MTVQHVRCPQQWKGFTWNIRGAFGSKQAPRGEEVTEEDLAAGIKPSAAGVRTVRGRWELVGKLFAEGGSASGDEGVASGCDFATLQELKGREGVHIGRVEQEAAKSGARAFTTLVQGHARRGVTTWVSRRALRKEEEEPIFRVLFRGEITAVILQKARVGLLNGHW